MEIPAIITHMSPIGFDKQTFWAKIVNIFLPSSFNICFGCSKEPSHWDGSFEYPQHMFWLKSKKINWYALLTDVCEAEIHLSQLHASK